MSRYAPCTRCGEACYHRSGLCMYCRNTKPPEKRAKRKIAPADKKANRYSPFSIGDRVSVQVYDRTGYSFEFVGSKTGMVTRTSSLNAWVKFDDGSRTRRVEITKLTKLTATEGTEANGNQ